MSQNLRIPVVDDDHSMASTLADICTIKGYEAETANSGAKALDRMTASHN